MTVFFTFQALSRDGLGNDGHTFNGSVLVSTLMRQGPRLTSRVKATRCAQQLLDIGHIRSITGQKVFNDSSKACYFWTDASIVRDAKKRVKMMAAVNPRPGSPGPSETNLIEETITEFQDRFKNPYLYQDRPSTSSSFYAENHIPRSRDSLDGELDGYTNGTNNDGSYARHSYDGVLSTSDRHPVKINTAKSKYHKRRDGSDNHGFFAEKQNSEKNLRDKMSKMSTQHRSVVKNYEEKINGLMVKMNELKRIAEVLERSAQIKELNGNSTLQSVSEDSSIIQGI